jgi:hypothetical protein
MKTFSHRAWSARIAVVLLGLLISTSCGRDGVAPTAPGSANLDRRGDWGSIKAPTLQVSDENVRFEDVEGEVDVSPVSVKVTVKDGDVQLTGLTVTSTSSPAGWLNATLDATTTPTRVVISVTTDNLSPDDYKGSVVVTAPGADKSPDEIKVRLTIDKAHRQLVVATAPAGAVAGVAFTTQPVIQILMVPSNKLSRDNDKVTAQLQGSSVVLGGTTTVKAHNGVATFTNLSVPTAGTYTLLFTADGDASVSVLLTVTPPPPPQVLLTVTKGGTGTGTVVSDVGGINCGTICSASYTSGATVKLTATPALGSAFSSWSDVACSGNGPVCTLASIGVPTTVNVNFVPLVLTSVAISGTPGSLTVGGTAQLTASPLDQFGNTIAATVSWSSSSTAASVSATGLVTAASAGSATITATATAGVSVSSTTSSITVNPVVVTGYTLTLTQSCSLISCGSVNASTLSNPAGTDCSSNCTLTFDPGTVVTLNLSVGDYNTFAWGGACASAGSSFTCILTMDSDKSVSTNLAHEHLVSSALRLELVAIAER